MIHLVYNRDMKAEISPDWITGRLHFPLRFVASWQTEQHCTVKVQFTGNRFTHRWCRRSTAITLCNQHCFNNDTMIPPQCAIGEQSWTKLSLWLKQRWKKCTDTLCIYYRNLYLLTSTKNMTQMNALCLFLPGEFQQFLT